MMFESTDKRESLNQVEDYTQTLLQELKMIPLFMRARA
jgi:cell fate (sporulation/competence/biofilm development) regulator YmcA (YheA/YmcA/DUF963 family)